MSGLCATWDTPTALNRRSSIGSSEAAFLVDSQLKQFLAHTPRMEVLIPEIKELAEESGEVATMDAGAIPIDKETARAAIEFAFLLPLSLPVPEVAPEPDGDISFDWEGPCKRMFSVSVNKEGRIAYAGRFGEKSKVHGIEQLSEVCPPEVLRGIEKATR
jgi:hypothetical protein